MSRNITVKVYPGELIGREITIVAAADPLLKGKQGKIVDESKSSLKVAFNPGGIKTLLKASLVFKLGVAGETAGETISGKEIARRPEDRLKGK